MRTQQQVFQALINGKKIRNRCFSSGLYIHMVEGMTVYGGHPSPLNEGQPALWDYRNPEDWEVVE